MNTHRITPEYLATLAKRRAIPPIFEQAWKALKSRNPVEDALTATEVEQEESRRLDRYSGMIFFSVVSTVGILLTALVLWHEIETKSWTIIPGAIIEAGFFISAVICTFSGVSTREKPVYASFDVEGVKQFCEALNSLISWSGQDSEGPFFVRGEEYLKKVASEILVEAAKDQLKLQCLLAGCSADQKNFYTIKVGEQGMELSRRYDLLKSIGLVPEGGYAKHFTLARKKMKEEMGKAPT